MWRVRGLNACGRTLMCRRRLTFLALQVVAPSCQMTSLMVGAEFPEGWGPANGGKAPARYLRIARRDLSWAWGTDPESADALNEFLDVCRLEATKIERRFAPNPSMSATERLDLAKANWHRFKTKFNGVVDSRWQGGDQVRRNSGKRLSLVGRRRPTRQCDFCEWVFATESELRRHRRNLHLPYGGNEPQPFECPDRNCTFSSKTKGWLARHVKCAHPRIFTSHFDT